MNKYQLGICAAKKIKSEIEFAYKTKNANSAFLVIGKLYFDIDRDMRNIINLLTKHDNEKTIAKKENNMAKKAVKKPVKKVTKKAAPKKAAK